MRSACQSGRGLKRSKSAGLAAAVEVEGPVQELKNWFVSIVFEFLIFLPLVFSLQNKKPVINYAELKCTQALEAQYNSMHYII